MGPRRPTDILVVGGGIAGYCAAIAARETGADVRLIDRAPRPLRGGNARHSRNLRIAHDGPSQLCPGRYPRSELYEDLRRASGGDGDAALAWLLAERSEMLPAWLQRQGVRFEDPAGGNLPWSRKTAFFLGGGKAMINALAYRAERLGVAVEQETRADGLTLDGAPPFRVRVRVGHRPSETEANALILCCGGYQANLDWLGEQWGDAALGFIVRGMPFADGELLQTLLAQGAAAAGTPGACHLVAVDARSPAADGGIVTRIDGFSWGIVVDRTGRRFHDEGAELSPRRYSHWGRLVASCPGQRAYLVLDAEGERRTTASIYPAIRAVTLDALACRLNFEAGVLEQTVAQYNSAVRRTGPDAAHTEGLSPAKSHRALPLVTPPFAAFPLAPGITFTSYGIRVDQNASVLRNDGASCLGLYAAGTLMAPAILGTSYLAGIGLTISAVFGWLAGERAAHYVLGDH